MPISVVVPRDERGERCRHDREHAVPAPLRAERSDRRRREHKWAQQRGMQKTKLWHHTTRAHVLCCPLAPLVPDRTPRALLRMALTASPSLRPLPSARSTRWHGSRTGQSSTASPWSVWRPPSPVQRIVEISALYSHALLRTEAGIAMAFGGATPHATPPTLTLQPSRCTPPPSRRRSDARIPTLTASVCFSDPRSPES